MLIINPAGYGKSLRNGNHLFSTRTVEKGLLMLHKLFINFYVPFVKQKIEWHFPCDLHVIVVVADFSYFLVFAYENETRHLFFLFFFYC